MSDQNNEKLLGQLKEALVAIRKLKGELQKERNSKNEPIAVIGMGMRLPGGVNNAEQYWDLLEKGIDAMGPVPKSRYDVDELYDKEAGTPGKIIVKEGGFLDNIDQFDQSFFDISPVELENVDPQQRILLEVTHEALENAGLDVLELNGSNTGVYVGVVNNDYQTKSFISGDNKLINAYSFTGCTLSANAGRISYLMGLQGPSVTMDTACSSSLVSTHLAAKALQHKECDIAIAGGVNIILTPETTIVFSGISALAPDGRCKTFDNSANGFARSEGCGIFVLKRLSDAQKDGDNILGIIKGSAINQDGRSNGFTAPNVVAQERLLRKALKDAKLNPEDIGYIEAHGTGTKIGDPIEIEAISKVFKTAKSKDNPLVLGSVKSNIGHLEAAAGIAGMMKAVLSLQKGVVPKNLHFNKPNELIHWESLPLKVSTGLTPFKGAVGISGFGVTGTNGHIIFDKTPDFEKEEDKANNRNDLFSLPISAKSSEALLANAKSYAKFIKESAFPLEDICAAAALNRSHYEFRHCFVAKEKAALIEQLDDFVASGQVESPIFDKEDPIQVVFVFSGHGAQWAGMGKELIEKELVFAETFKACNEAFKKYGANDLIAELEQDLSEIKNIQPLLLAMSISLGKWWQSKGIEPDIVVGHSLGEIAAGYIAGNLTLDDAAKIICTRSKLMMTRAGLGVMGATDLTYQEAEEIIKGKEDKLSISVANSPNSTVLSGDKASMDEIFKQLEAEGRFCRIVKIPVASHSVQMDPILEDLRNGLQSLQPTSGGPTFYSTALNKVMDGADLNADYWVKNLRTPVQFGKTIRNIIDNDKTIFIELGGHPVLLHAIQENADHLGKSNEVKGIASILRNKDEVNTIYSNLGELYSSGYDLNWKNLFHKPKQFVQLPNYQWQRERFWFDEIPEFTQKKVAAASIGNASDHVYEYDWISTTLEDSAKDKQHILFIQDADEIADKLGNEVTNQNATIEIADKENITAALTGKSFDKIVFVDGKSSENSNLNHAIEHGCLGLQSVIKSLEQSDANPTPLIVITNNGFAQENSSINASSALLIGASRTLRNEHPELNTVHIDIDDSINIDDLKIASQIILSSQSKTKEYVVRNGVAKAQVLQPAESISSNGVSFGAESCFLITGGTSGLGLAFAEYLASKGVAKVALVSRSGEKEATKVAMERMVSNGCTAKIFTADISAIDSVQTLISDITHSFGSITGVVHAAGLVDDGTFVNLDKQQYINVANPKVNGTLNLHNALKNQALTHFISFSSSAAVLGSISQANYNGANFYIDQLMHLRAASGLVATAVNWGNIGGIGLAAAQKNRGERLAQMGMNSIDPSEFESFFEIILNTHKGQVIPVKIDFDKWAETQPSILLDATFKNVLNGNVVESDSAVNQWGNSLAVASKKLKDRLKQHVHNITKISIHKIKEDETFKSMGIDSMMALQLKNKIQADTDLNLAVSSIWSHATVKKYAEFLIKELNLEDQFNSVATSGNQYTLKSLKDKLKQHIASITKIPHQKLKEVDTFKSMGIDSMQALQLKNKLQADFDLNLAVSSIWTHPTIEKYSGFLAKELGIGDNANKGQEESPTEKKTLDEINKEVDDLSLDELMNELDGY